MDKNLEKCEPVAYMYQHEETGNIGFIDQWQVDNGFQKNNPRLKIITSLYTSPQPIEKCEPVAYNHHFIYDDDFMPEEVLSHSKEIPAVSGMKYAGKTDELYTSPISKEWVVIDEETIDDIGNTLSDEQGFIPVETWTEFARAIEAKLKQLNAPEKS